MIARALRLPAPLAKELGALLPTWLAAMVVVFAAALAGHALLRPVAAGAFGLAAVVLGAQAVGHEYTHGTLAMLLAQPMDRRRVFAIKLGTLAVLLVTLTAATWLMIGQTPVEVARRGTMGLDALVAIAALAFFVAPLLSIVARGVLPGVVFTLAIPVALLVAGDLVGVAMHGAAAGAQIDALKWTVFQWGLTGVCAAAGVAGWLAFTRLEVADGPAEMPVSPVPFARRPKRLGRAGARHPVSCLAAKELRLQQMTCLVAGLYALLALVAIWIESRAPQTAGVALEAVTIFYPAVVALLAGAVASAEERQLGTLSWQALLPVSARLQWAIKSGVAIACALLLGVGLPLVIAAMHPAVLQNLPFHSWWQLPAIALVLTSAGLYVSSLSASAVKALVVSLVAVLGGGLFLRWTVEGVERLRATGVLAPAAAALAALMDVSDAAAYRRLLTMVTLVTAGGLVVTLIRSAMVNHRTIGTGAAAILRQIALVLGLLAGGVVAVELVTLAFRA